MKRARRSPISFAAGVSAAAVVFVLLLALVAALPAGGRPSTSSGARVLVASPDTANPNLYINRSQINGGTYVPEYVALNNSTSLTRLPFAGTSIHGCRWVTVLNLTEASAPASPFHSVTYANATTGNDSGTRVAGVGSPSFLACTGTPVWVNYIFWTYAVLDFSAQRLGNAQTSGTIPAKALGNLTLVSVTPTGYAGAKKTYVNTTYPFDSNHAVTLKIPTNESAVIQVPAIVNGATTCDPTGQICSFPQWSLVAASNITATSTNGTLTFTQPLKAAYNNWTASYAEGNVSANTYWGGGFVFIQNGLATIFFDNGVWVYWFVFIVAVIIIASIVRSGRRRH